MTPSKEVLEAASPAAKTSSPVAPAPKSSDASRLRADAVSLDVPVRVHGSRVTEVVRGVTPHTEPFEEETSTMIVFPQGGVVRMTTPVSVGQMLVLTNQRTKQDAICRVVKVRANSTTQSYVEVEFTHRQAGYWGVHFPADEEDGSATSSASIQPIESKRIDPPVISSVSMKVESISKAPTQPAKNESAFTSIGMQEEVQPSASSTDLKRAPAAASVLQMPTPPPPPVRASAPVAHVAPPAPAKVAPPPVRVAPVPEPVEEEAIEVAEQSEAEEVEAPRPSRSFGTLTGGITGAAQSARSSDFAARLGAETSVASEIAAPRSNSWMWIAACAFFLVAGLAAGALYFRQRPGASSKAAPTATNLAQPVEQAAAAPAAQTNQAASNSFAAAPVESAGDRSNRMPAQSVVPDLSVPQSRSANPSPARGAQPVAAPSQNFAISNPRPVAKRNARNNVETAAPSVEGGPALSAAMPDVLGGPASLAPPPPAPTVRVGGQIVQPKLLKSVPPAYPTAARQAGISGNVVITAQVDKAGEVGQMKVVSGPATLQSAALTAMRSWKYAPGTLDGSPVDTQVTVTMHFQQ